MPLRSHIRSFVIRSADIFGANGWRLRSEKLDPKSQALVVMMHETPAVLETQLRAQMEWAAQHFTITNLESFAKLWVANPRSTQPSKPLLLFTFDDGRESNYQVAAPLLESFGGTGVFFVVPEFAETAGRTDSSLFYRTRIDPSSRPDFERNADWRPMSPAQIKDLATRGHAIGNHSSTHSRLINLSAAELECEIGGSSRKIANWTGKPVDAFAWTFGWDAIDAGAWHVIRKHHRFCFSPCAGFVDAKCNRPALLWRREVEPRYSPAEYRFAYSGMVDPWWASRRKRLQSILK